MTVLDLFAGPGGWDVAARELGLEVLGVEWDDAACATREAAGLRTLQADVAELNPMDFAPCWGLIGSPPCQAFSMAGKGGGRRDLDHILACHRELAMGRDTRIPHRDACEDERSMLVVEPIRWALKLKPRWIALEQVPPVLELWKLFSQTLRHVGYWTWVGVLEAERYGVPQTRERAILMASLDGPVEPPQATHQRYVPGEPQRHDITFDGEVLPWVSMAQALGWAEGPSPSPSPSVTGGGGSTGGVEVFASKAARGRAERAVAMRANKQANAAVRHVEDPAPHDTGDRVWLAKRDCRPERKDAGAGNVPIPEDRPAPTIDSGIRQAEWTTERPATAVCADPRISPPGWRGNPEDYKRPEGPTRSGDNAVRVTIEQAAILQSFRPDYPWQGSRSKQFEQIGNAIPPLLARAILEAVL